MPYFHLRSRILIANEVWAIFSNCTEITGILKFELVKSGLS
jgi:hypothetical protein